MIVTRDFESLILAAHTPNFIELSDIDGNLYVNVTSSYGVSLDLKYIVYNNAINFNAYEVTRLLYDNLENYQDPFDYSADVTYDENSSYHYGNVTFTFTDDSESEIIKTVIVVNAALQVNECVQMGFFLNEPLRAKCNAEVLDDIYAFEYTLNQEMHT